MFKKLFSWLIGGTSTADNVINKGVDLVDKAFYTDQEKAEGKLNILQWYLKYQQATAPQNVSRRIIAFEVVSLWVLFCIVWLILVLFGFNGTADKVFNFMVDVIAKPFAIIIGFYYAAHVVRAFTGSDSK